MSTRSIPRFWRFNRQRCGLTGVQCRSCGLIMISPRSVCPACKQSPEDATASPVFRLSQQRQAEQSPTVSVIVPVCNARNTIAGTLASLVQQEVRVPYEIIVADSSTDGTAEFVREEFPMVHVLRQEGRMQAGTARNLGLGVARGKLIAFTDANCAVSCHWLQQLVYGHAAHPDCAAVGGPIVNGIEEHILCWAGYLAEFNIHLPVGATPHEVDHITTANIAYKRWVFDRYGGFPGDEMVEHGALLFNRMLHAQGEKMLFDPSIVVALSPPASLLAFLAHQKTIGHGTVQAMRRLPDIKGSRFVKHRFLTALATLAIVATKFVRNSARFARWSPEASLRNPLLFPLFGLGLFAWGLGFAGEALFGQEFEGAWQGNKDSLWIGQRGWGVCE